jgi:hypothetical protein
MENPTTTAELAEYIRKLIALYAWIRRREGPPRLQIYDRPAASAGLSDECLAVSVPCRQYVEPVTGAVCFPPEDGKVAVCPG